MRSCYIRSSAWIGNWRHDDLHYDAVARDLTPPNCWDRVSWRKWFTLEWTGIRRAPWNAVQWRKSQILRCRRRWFVVERDRCTEPWLGLIPDLLLCQCIRYLTTRRKWREERIFLTGDLIAEKSLWDLETHSRLTHDTGSGRNLGGKLKTVRIIRLGIVRQPAYEIRWDMAIGVRSYNWYGRKLEQESLGSRLIICFNHGLDVGLEYPSSLICFRGWKPAEKNTEYAQNSQLSMSYPHPASRSGWSLWIACYSPAMGCRFPD